MGYYLGVHEGPQDIRQNFNPQALLPGMVTSNEPGIYREGLHGIRHENIILTAEDETAGGTRSCGHEERGTNVNQFGEWLRFDTLTCCHIDTSAVIAELLTAEQRQWLNGYNAWVFRTLSPRLTPEERLWLEARTQAI